MSQHALKTSIPPPIQCPKITDDWIRKTELPPIGIKSLEHPDLMIPKSTIPPKQECPACICPKAKVNAVCVEHQQR